MERIRQLIQIKQQGKDLKKEQVEEFIQKLVGGVVTEAQLGAMLMAMYLKGLNQDETSYLTDSMAKSGATFSWPISWKDKIVDKHSTGGVGDKVSLVLVPILAALGLKVPMVSGRSLGHTGGTLDKLESIPGYQVEMSSEELAECVKSVGCCIAGQSNDVNPADKIMYKIRDDTGTVNYAPMIIASIISKKIMMNPDALIMDVKFGSGAFTKTKEEAKSLACTLVEATKPFGIKACAVLTKMDAPIGKYIGNALEVQEAVETLKGRGPQDVKELVTVISGHLLWLLGDVDSIQQGTTKVCEVLKNGTALKVFQSMIERHQVAKDVASRLCSRREDCYSVLPQAPIKTLVQYKGQTGYIDVMESLSLAHCAPLLGRHPGSGFRLLKVVGEIVRTGDDWLEVHHVDRLSDDVIHTLEEAIQISKSAPIEDPLRRVVETITTATAL